MPDSFVNSRDKVLERGREVIRAEADALNQLALLLDENFGRAVRLISTLQRQLVVTGMGNPAISRARSPQPLPQPEPGNLHSPKRGRSWRSGDAGLRAISCWSSPPRGHLGTPSDPELRAARADQDHRGGGAAQFVHD